MKAVSLLALIGVGAALTAQVGCSQALQSSGASARTSFQGMETMQRAPGSLSGASERGAEAMAGSALPAESTADESPSEAAPLSISPGSDAVPSLSQLPAPDTVGLGSEAGEQRIPESLIIAAPRRAPVQVPPASFEEQDRRATGWLDVYFSFDSWLLTEQAQRTLTGAAARLHSLPAPRVLLEGHCDERGTEAYNLILGEKRAQAVQHYLLSLGVPAARLVTVSYGNARPLCHESAEACYQQNRRVHLGLPPE